MKRRHFVRSEEESSDDELARSAHKSAPKKPGPNRAADQELAQPWATRTDKGGAPSPTDSGADPANTPLEDELTSESGNPIASDVGIGHTHSKKIELEERTQSTEHDNSDSPSRGENDGNEHGEASSKELSEESSQESGDESSSSSNSDSRPTFVRTRKDHRPRTGPRVGRQEAALSILAQEQNALQPIREHEVDDTDGIDPVAEYAAWKDRQIARQTRDKRLEEGARKRSTATFPVREGQLTH